MKEKRKGKVEILGFFKYPVVSMVDHEIIE